MKFNTISEAKNEKVGMLKLIFLCYKTIITNLIFLLLFIILVLSSIYLFPLIKGDSLRFFIMITFDILLYLIVVVLFEYQYFKRTKYGIKNIFFFFLIMLSIKYLVFSYILLIIPFLILLRNLDISSSFLLASRLIFNNIVKVFFVNIIQLSILGIVLGFPISMLLLKSGVAIATQEDIMIAIKPYMPQIRTISSLVLATQNYLLYKHIEYKDIIRG